MGERQKQGRELEADGGLGEGKQEELMGWGPTGRGRMSERPKRQEVTRVGKDVEKSPCAFVVSGNVNWYIH